MEKLIKLIKNYVEADSITEHSSFKDELGMSSFDIMCLITDIAVESGLTLKPSDFTKYSTVGEMYDYISGLI